MCCVSIWGLDPSPQPGLHRVLKVGLSLLLGGLTPIPTEQANICLGCGGGIVSGHPSSTRSDASGNLLAVPIQLHPTAEAGGNLLAISIQLHPGVRPQYPFVRDALGTPPLARSVRVRGLAARPAQTCQAVCWAAPSTRTTRIGPCQSSSARPARSLTWCLAT